MSPSHRRRLLLAALAVGSPAAAVVPASTGAAATTTSCASRVAAAAKRTDAGGTFNRVARSSSVQVFAPKGAGFGAYHYACWARTGALHRFARNSTGTASTDVLTVSIVVRGDALAYRTASRGDRSRDRFVVRDGRTGKVLRDTGEVTTSEKGGPRSDQLVLLPGAVIAWSAAGSGVHVTDADGDHVLAPAADGRATKLSTTTRTVSWTSGGERHHAPLP
ncbi:hypothetical protein [Patulibacter minatonensis]|uniref:hypothetical protein n=1 Tax=Patulibacter minatonensis TaxID=298163 RepID=UPI00047D9EA2|nr:hypothetical protein [Patulibacter minatonensis]